MIVYHPDDSEPCPLIGNRSSGDLNNMYEKEKNALPI